jgi:hypothetical protein
MPQEIVSDPADTRRPGVAASRRTWLDSQYVYKLQEPAQADVEAAKTIAAARVADDTGLFRVPRLIRHDRKRGLIVYERVPGLMPLCRACADDDGARRLGTATARALRAVHEGLHLDEALSEPLPVIWQDTRLPSAFVHGDFNAGNVRWDSQAGQVVILDWLMSDLWGGRGTLGPTCFDALWFIHSVAFEASGHRRSRLATGIIDAFVAGFFDQSGLGRGPVVREYMSRGVGTIQANHRQRRHTFRFAVRSVLSGYAFRLRRLGTRIDSLFPGDGFAA